VRVAVLLLVMLAACVRVPANERARLARPAMQAPVWPALSSAVDHVFVVREGTSGATTAGGGGCGCN